MPEDGKAQDANYRPARATEAANALFSSQWKALEEGVSVIQASTALGTRITALKLSQGKVRFSIEQQDNSKGERAGSVLNRTNAFIVINGGFFGERVEGDLYPVGKLIDDGNILSAPWIGQGGYLAIDGSGNIQIFSSQSLIPEDVVEAVQSRPVLMEPGRRWAMNSNGNEPDRRTLLCKLANGDIVLMLVTGGGLTLFEAGWLFRSPAWGGFFDCDSAIALDGGSSTQMSITGYGDLDISGLTAVQNFLVITKK